MVAEYRLGNRPEDASVMAWGPTSASRMADERVSALHFDATQAERQSLSG